MGSRWKPLGVLEGMGPAASAAAMIIYGHEIGRANRWIYIQPRDEDDIIWQRQCSIWHYVVRAGANETMPYHERIL